MVARKVRFTCFLRDADGLTSERGKRESKGVHVGGSREERREARREPNVNPPRKPSIFLEECFSEGPPAVKCVNAIDSRGRVTRLREDAPIGEMVRTGAVRSLTLR